MMCSRAGWEKLPSNGFHEACGAHHSRPPTHPRGWSLLGRNGNLKYRNVEGWEEPSHTPTLRYFKCPFRPRKFQPLRWVWGPGVVCSACVGRCILVQCLPPPFPLPHHPIYTSISCTVRLLGLPANAADPGEWATCYAGGWVAGCVSGWVDGELLGRWAIVGAREGGGAASARRDDIR